MIDSILAFLGILTSDYILFNAGMIGDYYYYFLFELICLIY